MIRSYVNISILINCSIVFLRRIHIFFFYERVYAVIFVSKRWLFLGFFSSSDDGNDEYPEDSDQNTLTSDDMCLGRGRSPSQDRSGRKRTDRHGLADFVFIKVLGKGSFGKVCIAFALIYRYIYFILMCFMLHNYDMILKVPLFLKLPT